MSATSKRMTNTGIVRLALSVPEAAEALGTSERQIREWVHENRLQLIPLGQGNKWLIPVVELQKFLDLYSKSLKEWREPVDNWPTVTEVM